jgi:5-methylthioribose kinase
MNLDKKSVPPYLRRKKLVGPREPIRDVRLVGNSLKNIIYQVTTDAERFIVKQARSRVNTKQRIILDRKRIFNEKNCIEILSQILPPDMLPEVRLEDRTNFILVSTAPPRDSTLWENDLTSGRVDLQIAAQCGELLATVHNHTADQRDLKSMFKDTKPFQQLRVEPLFNAVGNSFPDLKKVIETHSKSLLKTQRTLVFGDLRPCNVWLNAGQVFVVDFATAHFGNPAFDLAFYATDLCLKAVINSPQKAAYLEAINVYWSSYFRVASYPRGQAVETEAVRCLGCMILSVANMQNQNGFDDETKDLLGRIGQSLLFTELEKIEDITEFINRTLIDG